MSYSPKITFTQIFGDFRREESYICFSPIYGDEQHPDYIEYPAFIDKSLNEDSVKFYLDFLSKILNKEQYTFEFKTIGSLPCVLFTLKTSNLTRSKALLYLTAFRYIWEFPEIVRELFNRKSKHKNINGLFTELQILHWEHIKGKIGPVKYNNLCGHGLIYNYAWSSDRTEFKPVHLKDFLFNYKKYTKETTVQSFFVKAVRNLKSFADIKFVAMQ